MKLFIYEHITSGALSEQLLPESLAHEGAEMLSAVLSDCSELPHVELITLCDARLSDNTHLMKPEHHCYHSVSNQHDYNRLWQQCLNDADIIFIIAPETDDTLAQLQHQAFQSGKRVIGCSPEAIRLTTNKVSCEQALFKNNIATTQSCPANQWTERGFISNSGYIVKPIDGAGCLDTFLFPNTQELENYLLGLSDKQRQQSLVQAYIEGRAASLSLLITEQHLEVLAINQQLISTHGNKLQFDGCIVNDRANLTLSLEQATLLAHQINDAITGLSGFIGIDIIVSAEHVVVIEINPRLTTSYTGLRESLQLNPMARFLSMEDAKSSVAITHRNEVHIHL